MIGWPGSFASVNTIAMRVVSAATTNGPRSLPKLSNSGLGDFLFFRLVFYFRHPLGRSIGGALGTGVYEAKEW